MTHPNAGEYTTHIVRVSFYVTLTRVAGIILQMLIIVVLARTLSVRQMGVFALSYAVLGFARILGPLGMDQVTLRLVAASECPKNDTALHLHLTTSQLLVMGINGIFALVVSGACVWFSGEQRAVLCLTAAALPAFAINGLLSAQIRGFGHNIAAQVPDSIVLQILFGLGLAAIMVAHSFGLKDVLVALTVASWTVAVVYAWLFVRSGGAIYAKSSWETAGRLLRESGNVLCALVVTALSARAPLFLSAALLGPVSTAILDLATRFGTLSTITTSSVSVTFSPQFAALARADHRRDLAHSLSLSSLLAGTPALLCVVAIAAGAPFAIRAVLPPAYAETYFPMLVISIASAVNAVFGLTSALLMMARHATVVRNFSVAQLVIICALAVCLGLSFGVNGLAVAILAGSVVRDLGLSIWASRHFGISVPPFALCWPSQVLERS